MISDMRSILKRSTVKRHLFFFLFLLAASSSFLEILPAEIVGRFSSRLTGLREDDALPMVLSWCAGYFLVVALGAAVRNLFCYMTSKAANTLIKDIRTIAFSKFLSLDMSKLPNTDSGYFVNMINGNSARLETVFSVALFTLVSDIFDLFWISVFICMIDWRLWLIMAAFVPGLLLLGKMSSKMQKTLAFRRIDIESGIISKIHGVFVNRPAIRVFGGQQRETGEFAEVLEQYRTTSNKADATLGLFYAAEKTIRYIAISLVIFVTAMEIVRGRYPVGSLVSIVLYSQKFYSPITNIIRYIQMLQKGMASVTSLQTFLDCEDADLERNLIFTRNIGFASVEDVSVTADGKTILPETSFTLKDRTLNLVTGASGCGKSTLIKALLGEVPLSGGSIRVSESLNRKMLFSYASQDTEVFSGSILDNVLYPETKASPAAIHRAQDLLSRLGFSSDQWDRDTGEAGSALSGGEKKRIAFARALLRPSAILILDEITSNLDPANEEVIARMIAEESQKRCVILITHKDHPRYAQADVRYLSPGKSG